MHKEYTINALIEGNSALKQALKKLRDLRVGSKNIDYLSHLDSEEKSVRIVKYHKGHLCAFYGFLFGAALGLLILFLNQIEVQFALLEAHPQIIIENIWIYLASGGAAAM